MSVQLLIYLSRQILIFAEPFSDAVHNRLPRESFGNSVALGGHTGAVFHEIGDECAEFLRGLAEGGFKRNVNLVVRSPYPYQLESRRRGPRSEW